MLVGIVHAGPLPALHVFHGLLPQQHLHTPIVLQHSRRVEARSQVLARRPAVITVQQAFHETSGVTIGVRPSRRAS